MGTADLFGVLGVPAPMYRSAASLPTFEGIDMTIGERNRHQLYLRLEAVLGTEEATTLMEHLPPVGWADVATKTDLHALEQHIELRFEAMDHRFDNFDHRLDSLENRLRADFQRDLRTTMIAVMAGNAAIVAAVVSTIAAITTTF